MIAINKDRLWSALMDLSAIGSYVDDRTGLRGVNRLALTDADRDARRQVVRWMEDAGLTVRIDRIGNIFGCRAGKNADAAPVMSGSHIDSVPTGGAFDGALGVLGALEVVRTLNDNNIETERPIDVAVFTDEEGARFGTDMLGSATATGRIALEDAYALTDRNGRTVKDALERIEFSGDAPLNLRDAPPHAFVELHIEQGPVLATAGTDLGVVTGVQAISWLELTIDGKSAHAGTTPMDLRADAGVVAAKISARMHEMATSATYGEAMRATMGRIDLAPNQVNVVPARAVCTVDLRNPDDVMMEKAERDLTAFIKAVSAEHGVAISTRQTARTASVRFNDEVMATITHAIDEANLSHQRLVSGAGHDAQELAAICPAAMIFVPGEHNGISHNPREHSSPEACEQGANVLLQTIRTLADRA